MDTIYWCYELAVAHLSLPPIHTPIRWKPIARNKDSKNETWDVRARSSDDGSRGIDDGTTFEMYP